MKSYIDITLLPSPEIGLYFLWEKVFQQIHLGLVEIQHGDGSVPIAVSLPEYDGEKNRLGSKLRLLSTDGAELERFNATKWLNRLTDYIHLTRVRAVPDTVSSYVRFKRKQPKTHASAIRLAKRKAIREGSTMETTFLVSREFKEQNLKTPFINIKSQSTGQRFRLFIVKEQCTSLINSRFNSYGLSNTSSIPEF